MPYVINRPHKRVMVLVAACFALLCGSAHSALAAQTCSNPSTSTVFAPFSDTSGYILMPGGSFEAGTSWKWSGGTLVADNEPWYVHGTNDAQALSIAPASQVVAPPVCVSALRPTFRFFAVATDPKATLNLALQYTDPITGLTAQLPIGTLSGADYASWSPTSVLGLGSLLTSTGVVNGNVVFTTGSVGSWEIDDVYVDPYSR